MDRAVVDGRSRVTRRGMTAAAGIVAAYGPLTRLAKAATVSIPPEVISPTGYPADVTSIYTGAHSHWLQPWRTLAATRSFAAISGGIGLNTDTSYPQSLQMFAAAGFRHVRMSLFWGSLPKYDPTHFDLNYSTNSQTLDFVWASKEAGLRPLVLVQAFDQGPCPYELIEVTASDAIASTDTTITVSSATGLVTGYSGLTGWVRDVTDNVIKYVSPSNVMCSSLITAINGNVLSLSRPVGIEIPKGATLLLNTLLYKPWSEPGSEDYLTTMVGWLDHLVAVSCFMQVALDTVGAPDAGFDIEIWNETSFGSSFLDINNYYASPIVPETMVNGIPAVIPDLVGLTSSFVSENPSLFAGVRVTDGFASVSPMQASSTEPDAISAISKHPYPSPLSYPKSDPGYGGLDANGNPTTFIPSYTIYTHEYYSTAINPFTLSRDIATTPNNFGGVIHGVDGRMDNGVIAPVTVWMTEIGTATASEGVTDPDAIALLTAKGTLRALFFNLGIGVERVYIFDGVGDTTDLAMVPASAPTTPTLVVQSLQSALAFMANDVTDDQAGVLIQVGYTVTLASGATDSTLWTGNGTAVCPDFVKPADYVLLPVQVTPRRIALLHWFTGLDMRTDMAAAAINLTLYGLPDGPISLSGLDPIGGDMVTATVTGQTSETVTIRTSASDRPFILTVDLG